MRVALASLLLTLAACDWWSSKSFLGFGDDRGYWLPLTVALKYDASVTDGAVEYKDNCQQAKGLPLGAPLSEALTRQIGLVFEHVQYDALSSKGGPPDGTVEVALGLKELDLFLPPRREGTYPAKLTLGATANYFDQEGKLLFTKSLRTETKGKVETDSRSCDVRGLEKLAADASMLLAQGLKKHLGTAPPIRRAAQEQKSGQRVAGIPTSAPAPPMGSAVPSASAPASAPTAQTAPAQAGEPIPLSFRAMLRDENGNQILEGGERVTVKAEVTNTGQAPLSGVTLALSGTPALVQALRNPVPVGDLQPGETKRVEVSGKLPAVSGSQQAELIVGVETASGVVQQAPKKFIAALRSGLLDEDIEVLSVDVDQIPRRVRGYEQRKTVGIAIGVGKFRDADVPPVKFAAHDAETIAKYFRAVGGIPADQIKLLTDDRALKEDLAELFEDWLPRQMKKDGVVVIYFSGRAVVDSAGAVSLVPHEGHPKASSRLYSLRRLHSALARLPSQHAVLFLDVSLEGPAPSDRRQKEPNWNSQGDSGEDGKLVHIVSATGLQEAHRYDRGRHGLFTYYVLKGMSGAADGDRDGQIAMAELFDYVRAQVLKSAKTEYGNEQEPALVPELSPNAKVWDLPLARVGK